MRIVTVDIGGTAIKSAVWDGTELTDVRECPTDAHLGGAKLMEKVQDLIQGYGEMDAIGISTAGQVDSEKGSIYYANDNIPNYTGMPIKRMLEERFHVPVAVENDVNAAALGEMYAGAAKGLSDFLCLTYGTGVGGAIVLGGKLYTGSAFSAGSFGGIVIHPECIDKDVEYSGCYEKHASTTALVAAAKKVDASLTNGRLIFEAAQRPEVKAVIDAWIDEVVLGLITLVHVFNPSDIILGGGVMGQHYVIEEAEKRLNASVSSGFRSFRLHVASLGNSAGLMGAASLAAQIHTGKRE